MEGHRPAPAARRHQPDARRRDRSCSSRPRTARRTPRIANAAEVVLQPFPAAAPNVDLTATVTAVDRRRRRVVPADGAVLMATGAAAAKLQAEAPVGTPVTSRLILQPAWAGVVAALGGGPVLVRNSQACLPLARGLHERSGDAARRRVPASASSPTGASCSSRSTDGQPGYSVGLTSFELAQTLQRLGAVSASAVDPGASVTAAFDGQLLNRPSDPGGERAVKEALLVAVLRRLRGAAAAAAAERRPGPVGRAAELQDRPPVDGDRAADRPRQRAARARGRRRASARAPIRSRSRTTTSRAPGTGTCRRPTTSGRVVDDRPRVPVRHDAEGSLGAAARAWTRDVPLHARARGEGAAADRDEERHRHALAGAGRALPPGTQSARLGRTPAARDARRTPGRTSRTSSRRARSAHPTLLFSSRSDAGK